MIKNSLPLSLLNILVNNISKIKIFDYFEGNLDEIDGFFLLEKCDKRYNYIKFYCEFEELWKSKILETSIYQLNYEFNKLREIFGKRIEKINPVIKFANKEDINLDLEPKKRWNHILEKYKNQIPCLKNIIEKYKNQILGIFSKKKFKLKII
jgi:hypothetical protein